MRFARWAAPYCAVRLSRLDMSFLFRGFIVKPFVAWWTPEDPLNGYSRDGAEVPNSSLVRILVYLEST